MPTSRRTTVISLIACCSCILLRASVVRPFVPIDLIVPFTSRSSLSSGGVVERASFRSPDETAAPRTASLLSSTKTTTTTSEPIDDTHHNDILTSLFGSPHARDHFFTHNFGTHAIHIQHNGTVPTSLRLPIIDDDDDDDGRLDVRALFDTAELLALRKRGNMIYMDDDDDKDKAYEEFCGYVREGGSAVIPVAEGNVLMPFREEVEEAFRRRLGGDSDGDSAGEGGNVCTVGINVYHSGPSGVALNRHCDQYDVLVLHLEGRKEWEIGVFGEDHVADPRDPAGGMEAVYEWRNLTMVPGDLLYIPKGVFHAATTAQGYETTTHATIGIEY